MAEILDTQVSSIGINKNNVGRIAERIVSNELEFNGFRVSDLNKEGTSSNADLVAVKDGIAWQIQVKGSSWTEKDGCWFSYGYSTEEIIAGKVPMFNRSKSFYRAEIVVLVAVKSPKDYSFIALPVDISERAAQINLDRQYRTKKRDGGVKKPNMVWVEFYIPPRLRDADKKTSLVNEQELLKPYKDNWNVFVSATSAS